MSNTKFNNKIKFFKFHEKSCIKKDEMSDLVLTMRVIIQQLMHIKNEISDLILIFTF